ncbi:MAG: site-specific integrase [Pseudomonadota bacterium]|jgi:integrase|nr:site-specific integrase [Pseudomonadota bacterium]
MRKPTQKKNGHWQLRYLDNGKIRERSFRTRREADAFVKLLAAAEADKGHFEQMLAAGRAVGVNVPQERPGALKFEELVEKWRASHLTTELRQTTLKDYRESLKRLLAAFRGREVRSIEAEDLERLRNSTIKQIAAEQVARVARKLADIERKDVSKRTEPERALLARAEELRAVAAKTGPRAAGKMIGCAKTLWKFACARKLATFNPTDGVRKPKAARQLDSVDTVVDSNILTPSECERLLAATPAEHRCAVQFLFQTGCRLGELRGLAWTDIDWASARVLVRRQRSGLTGELTQPKTEAGTRWIELPAELVTELKRHRLRTPGEFVFTFDERNWRSRIWAPSLRRAGLRAIRIHDARHTHASWLLAAGADIVAVSRRLGHADPAVTLRVYSHFVQRRGAAGLGDQLAAFIARECGGGRKVAAEPAREG